MVEACPLYVEAHGLPQECTQQEEKPGFQSVVDLVEDFREPDFRTVDLAYNSTVVSPGETSR